MKINNKKQLLETITPTAKRALIMLIFKIASKLGGEARLVGGVVRDWLSGQSAGDVDMVVNLPIKKFAKQMAKEGIKVLETGRKHGTVTLYDAGTKIEVTQTRVDLTTDGRHATVAFKRDWIADASRRDFTINAIYLDESGKIFDPLGGREDLRKGRLRFAGDAKSRIFEDALRIIRYCRFLPRFGWGEEDKETQNVLRENAHLCLGLSGERIASELRQIMIGNGAIRVIGFMSAANIDQAIVGVKFKLIHVSAPPVIEDLLCKYGWVTVLAAVIPVGSGPQVAEKLKLSRKEERCLLRLDIGISNKELAVLNGGNWRQMAYHLGDSRVMLYLVQSLRDDINIDIQRCDELAAWRRPKFPICGADLLSHGVDKGLGMGQLLLDGERDWVASNFTISRETLLDRLLKD